MACVQVYFAADKKGCSVKKKLILVKGLQCFQVCIVADRNGLREREGGSLIDL